MSILGSAERLSAALAHLGMTIDTRAETGDASASWTAKLLSRGVDACADKAEEEAGEFIQALRGESDDRVASEAADMLYHALSPSASAVSASTMWPLHLRSGKAPAGLRKRRAARAEPYSARSR